MCEVVNTFLITSPLQYAFAFTHNVFVRRIHAGIDEMDIFINIDLDNFFDVSLQYMLYYNNWPEYSSM